MILEVVALRADRPGVLVLQAIAIATTMGLVWFCAAVVGDLAVRERSIAERVAEPDRAEGPARA